MTSSPLVLDQERAKRLLGYIQAYRRYTLTQVPSTGRNTHQRLLQALQGRLIMQSEREQQPFTFFLTAEEIHACKGMVHDLVLLKAQEEPRTEQRNQTLVDLTRWKGVFEQRSPSESRKQDTKRLAESQEQR